MFSFFKKKQAVSSKGNLREGGPIIAALLLKDDSFPVDDFLKQASNMRIEGKIVSGIIRRVAMNHERGVSWTN